MRDSHSNSSTLSKKPDQNREREHLPVQENDYTIWCYRGVRNRRTDSLQAYTDIAVCTKWSRELFFINLMSLGHVLIAQISLDKSIEKS